MNVQRDETNKLISCILNQLVVFCKATFRLLTDTVTVAYEIQICYLVHRKTPVEVGGGTLNVEAALG